jgi:hypothetical protein
MGRRARRAAAVLGATAIGGLVAAQPAAADQGQFTYTHASGQRVTCQVSYDSGRVDHGGPQGGGGVYLWGSTSVLGTDPRCAATVVVNLFYRDSNDTLRDVWASGTQEVSAQSDDPHHDLETGHQAFFTECDESAQQGCWVQFQRFPK